MREESSNFWLAEIRRRNAPDLSLKRQCTWVFVALTVTDHVRQENP
jgi:hypothetical protein